MKKITFLIGVMLMIIAPLIARVYDGNEKIYLRPSAVSWWLNHNAKVGLQFKNGTNSSLVEIVKLVDNDGVSIWSATVPQGDWITVRVSRHSSLPITTKNIWNQTLDITIHSINNYIQTFAENSSEATWQNLKANYRSKQSGNWNNISTWLATFDTNWANSSNYFDAHVVPNNNDLSVTLMEDHNITISSNLTAGNSTINSGASLIVNPNIQFSTGTLTNNGTLTLKSDANGTATLLNSGTVSGSGTYNVEQYLAHARNWYVSSPVSNANALGGFEYWQYNEPNGSSATENWTVVSASTPLVPGRGYIVKPSAETTYAFSTTTGTLNTGDITVPLTRTVGVTKEGFNLVGNPYPSYLNASDLLAANRPSGNEKVENNVWFRTATWNAGASKFDFQFQTFNASGNINVPQAANGSYIPPMQSFWVRALAHNVEFNFTNAMRLHNQTAVAIPLRAPANNERQLIRLQLQNGDASDETVIYTNALASDAFDRFDTHKMLNNSAAVPDIYSMLGSQKLVINGMQSLPLNIEMPLGILVKEAGSFSIRASEVRAIDADIVLIDKLNGNAEWLLNGGAEYQFASSTTTHAERFALVLRAPGTTTGECCNDILGAQTMVFVDAFKNINISCAMAVNKNAKVAIYNAVGQMLTQQNLENGVARIAVANHGVYLVELNVDGLKTTKRVIVK